MHAHVVVAQAAVLVFQCPVDERLDIVDRKWLELEHAAAADQRAVDCEERVLGGRPHKDDDAVLHLGQQHILLGLIEAVDFVDEEQGSSRFDGEQRVGLIKHFP